jgi:NAD(P)-dependent dehydrogenase (short-subunit alcohol dehydrogenase family)
MPRVFLTGASSGLGYALAQTFIDEGYDIALAARRTGPLLELVQVAVDRGQRAIAIPLDVADTSTIAPAVARASEFLGGLDIVIANAGVGIPAPALELRSEDLKAVLDVNVLGAAETLLAARAEILRSKGVLVGVSSLAAWRAGPGAAAYNASKSALSAFLEAIRPEFFTRGVAVMEVNPGFVRTPMTDRNGFAMPFLLEPTDAARRVFTAIRKRKSRFAFPRRAAFFMGLLHHLPDWAFDLLARRVCRSLEKKQILGREVGKTEVSN